MNSPAFDVAVLGSGFAGSLTAMILQRVGRRVVLVDKARHPRFAIGESSTPIANMVLRDLAQRYDLPRLLPLTRYGTWQASYPQIGGGLKRGFSYFAHRPGSVFTASATHANELLVAASSDDHDSDTQWLRADVDQFFCREAASCGVTVLEESAVHEIRHEPLTEDRRHWSIRCQSAEQTSTLRCAFVVDATGEAGLLPRSLGIASDVSRCRTRSRAIFSHFRHVASWNDLLKQAGARTHEHPFHCDHAAQHHILNGAWLWMLRFNNGLTSAGLVLDQTRHPLDPACDVSAEWQDWLTRYPSVAAMFATAELAGEPGELVRTGRLQRRWSQLAGEDWALLPHTAGFVDPLHSTGIAHSLCGVERLVRILDQQWHASTRGEALRQYAAVVDQELDLIDELVATCFASFERFDLLVIASMLYFAAATTYERRRHGDAAPTAYLCADQPEIRERLRVAASAISHYAESSSHVGIEPLRAEVRRWIAPLNHVGLLDASVSNMYHHTVAPT